MQILLKSIGLFPLTSVGFRLDSDILSLGLFISQSARTCVCMNAYKEAQ